MTHPLAFRIVSFLAVCACGTGACEAGSEMDAEGLGGMSLEELMKVRVDSVYGASKYEQKVTRAPASVSILTAEEISLFGYRTLAEALQSMRGLYVSNDRNYSYLGARGVLRPGDYNSRLLFLIDGHRMNDNVYDGAYVSREGMVSLDLVERIEFVRGPSSSIYGSSAFFGIVNVVLKRAKDAEGVRLSASAGSFGQHEATATLGGIARNGLETTLSASYYQADGHHRLYYPEFDPAFSLDPRAANGGMSTHADGERAVGVTGSAELGKFRLAASVVSRQKDVPTASFGSAFNQREQTVDQRGSVDLQYETPLSESVQLLGRVAYDRYVYEGNYPYDYAPASGAPEIVVSRDETLGESLSSEWQVTQVLSGGHTIVGGFEFRDNFRQRQLSFADLVPRAYEVQDDRESRNGALYAQGELRLSDRALLNAGLRYDHYFGSFGGTLNPRVGLILSPTLRSTFKLLYGEAFRAPSAYERFYYPANANASTLQPETIRTYEAVFEQYLGLRDRVNVSVYRYDVSGLITQQASSAGDLYFSNLSSVSADGVEIELERKYGRGALVRASYAFQKTFNPDSHEELTSSPRHLAKLNLAFPFLKWGSVSVEAQFQSAVKTLANATEGAFTVVNLSAQSAPRPHGFQVSAGVYNLFDVRYAYPGAQDHVQDTIAQDGRTFSVKAIRRL